jgi:hypothetical protein
LLKGVAAVSPVRSAPELPERSDSPEPARALVVPAALMAAGTKCDESEVLALPIGAATVEDGEVPQSWSKAMDASAMTSGSSA